MSDDGWRGRRAARVVLLDPDRRVLLLNASDPGNPAKGEWWEIPGGGQDPGGPAHLGEGVIAQVGVVEFEAGLVEVGGQRDVAEFP